jgi:FkbM family methyltransferase
MSLTIDALAWVGHWIGKPPGWERLVRLLTSPEKCRDMHEIRVVHDGSVFIAQPGVQLGWHVTLFGTYEPELRRVFRSVLSPGGVALDVGANVGWHTLLMARLVGEGGRVLAAEANPSVRARLIEHLELNRVVHVEVLPCALGDTEGSVAFEAPDRTNPAAGDGHVVESAEAGKLGVIRVESRTLDTICAAAHLERLDLVKIDVEGFEWPVLKGGEQTISRLRPHIVFEYLDEYAGRGGGTAQLMADFFARHHYRLFALGRREATAVDSGRWPSAANLWAVPQAIAAASMNRA